MRYNSDTMKKLKLYLDTSIINFVFYDKRPEEQKLTVQLFDEIREGKYEVFISEIVLNEIDRAPQDIAKQLKAAIEEFSPEELVVDEEVQELANKYMEQGVIPVKYRDDALHIAVASVNSLDVIVSWNFKHIVKLKTKREVTGINALMGYKQIEIYSPLEVVENV